MMEVAAVKRDFRAFSQHLEQLLKSDDKPMGKNENDEEKEFSTPKEESKFIKIILNNTSYLK